MSKIAHEQKEGKNKYDSFYSVGSRLHVANFGSRFVYMHFKINLVFCILFLYFNGAMTTPDSPVV